ncbi:MAG: hypothetical protein K2K28_01740, partial [Clostridia bacterium]|nr:hypothetical protein [Clostridia bacterium]
YMLALIVMGVPILNAEIALGRKMRGGAPKCMAGISKKAEPLGWASCFNSLIVAIIYAGLLGWILAMVIKIAPLSMAAQSAESGAAGGYFFSEVLKSGGISPLVLVCGLVGWALMYFCLRGGASSLSKTAKFTVIIPMVLLTFMAVRGLLYFNSGEALRALFIPDFKAFLSAELWLNALGQVFFSLSILVGIMPAYGAYLPEGTNIFRDSLIIAAADFFVSVLSSVVLFTTLYGCGMQGQISESGIVTAFIIYPVAITRFSPVTALNACVGVLFYLSLAMMATQSAVSMAEAAANPLAEKFNIKKRRIVGVITLIGAAVCILFATPVAETALDIADHFANYFNILFLGIAECILLGRKAKENGLVGEINRYTRRLKMPDKVFNFSLKYLCPAVLTFLTAWAIYRLIFIEGGKYSGYPLWAQAAFGWLVSVIVFSSGFVIKLVSRRKKKTEIRVRKLSL